MNYYAVHRTGEKDELTHWKYIKKIKGANGKTRYIYDQSELDKFDKEATIEKKNKEGGTDTVEYRKTDKLFKEGDKTTINSVRYIIPGGKTYTSRVTTKSQGKLDRAYAKGEKLIYDTFLKKNSKVKQSLDFLKKHASKTIDKGQKEIEKLLKKAKQRIQN